MLLLTKCIGVLIVFVLIILCIAFLQLVEILYSLCSSSLSSFVLVLFFVVDRNDVD